MTKSTRPRESRVVIASAALGAAAGMMVAIGLRIPFGWGGSIALGVVAAVLTAPVASWALERLLGAERRRS